MPEIFHTDNNIKIIYGAYHHPQSQGAVEAYNKTIIQKIQFFKLQYKDDFVINVTLNKAIEVYNNTIHSIIKIEPIKAFKMKKKK